MENSIIFSFFNRLLLDLNVYKFFFNMTLLSVILTREVDLTTPVSIGLKHRSDKTFLRGH